MPLCPVLRGVLLDSFWHCRSFCCAMKGPRESRAVGKLTTREGIAARYDASKRSVDRWVSQGILPVIRLSPRMVRFDVEACDEAIKRFERVAV
jgi:hypothetical protein